MVKRRGPSALLGLGAALDQLVAAAEAELAREEAAVASFEAWMAARPVCDAAHYLPLLHHEELCPSTVLQFVPARAIAGFAPGHLATRACAGEPVARRGARRCAAEPERWAGNEVAQLTQELGLEAAARRLLRRLAPHRAG